MTVSGRSHIRGWPCEFKDGQWMFTDNGQPTDKNRACWRCGRKPTPEGYDACVGHIPGAASACCGHGVEEGFVIMPTFSESVKEISTAKEE